MRKAKLYSPNFSQRRPNKLAYAQKPGRQLPERDEELDEIVGLITESSLTYEEIAKNALKAGYVINKSTPRSWVDNGDRPPVRRPQNHSINAVMAGLGYKKQWIKK